MSIKYTVVPNPLQPGQYYPRPLSLDTKELNTILREVAEKTTVSPHDAKAVVSAFIQEIINGLIDGDRVSIDEFADFRPRLSQVMQSASDEFDPNTGELLIAATIKPQVTKQVRRSAQFEKLMQGTKEPLMASFFDEASKQLGHYTAGSIATIAGENLKLPDPGSPDEGIYFVSAADGSESKVTVISNNGDRKLVFDVPVGLTGAQNVEVRTRYTPSGQLRTGMLENVLAA